MSEESSSTAPVPQKQKFFRGPRPLNQEERRNAKIAYLIAFGGIAAFLLQLFYFVVRYSIHDWLCILLYWILFLMPGYAANAGMLIWGGGAPMDGGRVAKDGRRLFGEGKTWRGFFLGPLLFGIPLSIFVHWILFLNWGNILNFAYGFLYPEIVYKFYETNPDQLFRDLALYMLGDANAVNPGDANWSAFWKLLPRIVLCAFGAPVGDLVKSYYKRRRGHDRGEPWWFADQLDFALGCLLMAGWFTFLTFDVLVLHIVIMLFVISPTITVVANTTSYLTGHKKVPW
jgi:CDP-2,3-bis-(O-geranylgeranyl)-sn-glycerol synthase